LRFSRLAYQPSKRTHRGAGHQQHLPEVVILGLAVGLAIDPVVAGDLAVAVGPQQGDQVDAADDLLVLARPVVGDQVDLAGVQLVVGAVVDDEHALVLLDQRLGLVPEGPGVGFLPVQQPRERVVGRGEVRLGLHARGLRTTDDLGGGDQELDVILVGTARGAHSSIIGAVNALPNWTLVN